MAVAVILLLMMGRVPYCTCGEIWLWSGDIATEHNSQHILDPYSFTHLSHGFLFFGILWLIGRRWKLESRLVVAVALETFWEVLENTDWVIDLYRSVTISWGYYGDSVLNSISDISVMILGFILASKLPFWLTILIFIILEFILAWWIKDNLTLNILMLVYPIEAVRSWQMK